MKKEVLITVTGLLYTGDGEDEEDYIDVITPGLYYYRSDKHFLVFDEQVEECDTPIHNVISIAPGRVEIKKSGVISTQMLFEPKKETRTWYATPFGQLDMEMYTRRITIQESENCIDTDIRYKLLMGGTAKSDCFVHIRVQPQTADGGFALVGEE